MRERVGSSGPLFHELGNKKASQAPNGSFFTSLEMRERVGSSGPLFHELGNKKASQAPNGSFFTSFETRERVGSGWTSFSGLYRAILDRDIF